MSFTYEERRVDSLFIDKIWHTYTTSDGVYTANLDGNWDIIITKRNGSVAVTVNGIGTEAVQVRYTSGIESIGIALKPGVFLRDYKGKDIVDSQHILNEDDEIHVLIGGKKFIIPDFESAESFIKELEMSGLILIDSIVTDFSNKIGGAVASRTLRRHTSQTTGLSPHFFNQIERATYATKLITQGMPLIEVASEAGYADQAHMTKDLKRIIGRTPSRILSDNQK